MKRIRTKNEIWKNVHFEWYKDYFQVSNFGRVRNLTRTVIYKNENK